MISTLLIATKENAEILKKISEELEFSELRTLIGSDWSFELFLRSDLRNFRLQTHFVFDISAFRETGDEFITLLEGIFYQNENATVILLADKHYPDDFLNSLFEKGFHNIVAGYKDVSESENVRLMLEDLRLCFDEGGLPEEKYVRFDKNRVEQIEQAEELGEDIISYKNAKFAIAVCSSQPRIGATTLSIHLADYFVRYGAKAAVIMHGENGKLQHKMLQLYLSADEIEGGFVSQGVHFYADAFVDMSGYNVIIHDCGTDIIGADRAIGESDQLILCGGLGWNELPRLTAAEKQLIGYNYTIALNFATEELAERYDEIVSQNMNPYIVMPFAPVLFGDNAADRLFEGMYEAFIQVPAEDNEEILLEAVNL